MPITLITGPANAGKARAVLDAVRRHVAHGEQPLLVVPTGADADRYRHELAQDGPVAGVHVCLFGGLLDRVARCAAAQQPTLGRPPLSAGAREQMLATLIRRGSQGAPGGGRGLARALGAAIAELQAAGVSPARLRAALGGGEEAGGDGRERLLVELHERYDRILARHCLLDAELRARRALDALRRSPALWRAGPRPAPVLLYGFDDLTALQLDTVETLGRAVDAAVTVSLAYEPGRVAFAGRAWAFQELSPLASEHIELGPRSDHYAAGSRAALHRIERRLFEAGQDAERPAPAVGVRLLEGGSLRGEMELVAAEVRALLDEGLAPEQIAIVHRAPARIADALAQALDAVGAPHAIVRRLRLADTALGRALIGLLRCGCAGLDGVGEASVADLLAWLRAPGLLERAELADRLEGRALRAGARDAALARQLWEREHWPLEAIDRVAIAAARGPASLLERAQRDLMRLFSAPRQRRAALLDPAEDEAALALRAALAAISKLRELARIDPELVGGAAGVLDALQAAKLPRARTVPAAAVAVLDPLSLRARRVRALFACGLQEGTFPAPARPDPILSEELRARIAAICGRRLAHRQDALAAERYLLYATVSRPEERLFLSWHACSDEGLATPRSLFVDDVCDIFDAGPIGERQPPAAGAIAEFAAASGQSARAGAPGQSPSADAPGQTAIATPASAASRDGIDAIHDQRLLDELRERRVWSASSLERWAACPVSWFVERLLGAEDLDPEPEPRARGTLAHAVLGEALAVLRRETGSARIAPASLARARALVREALAREREEPPLSVAAERLPLARRRLEADLDRYLQHAAHQDSPLEPAHLELSFGFEDEPDGLPALELGDGVVLRGRIDRVDVGAGGEAVVYDYKSGRTGPEHSGARWAQAGRFQIALYMRAVEELLGLQAVGGLYQPLAGSDLRARGALARDAGVELRCVRTDGCDREELAELVGAASQAAAQAAREARAGALQPRPQTCGYGGGCRYPTICRCGR